MNQCSCNLTSFSSPLTCIPFLFPLLLETLHEGMTNIVRFTFSVGQ